MNIDIGHINNALNTYDTDRRWIPRIFDDASIKALRNKKGLFTNSNSNRDTQFEIITCLFESNYIDQSSPVTRFWNQIIPEYTSNSDFQTVLLPYLQTLHEEGLLTSDNLTQIMAHTDINRLIYATNILRQNQLLSKEILDQVIKQQEPDIYIQPLCQLSNAIAGVLQEYDDTRGWGAWLKAKILGESEYLTTLRKTLKENKGDLKKILELEDVGKNKTRPWHEPFTIRSELELNIKNSFGSSTIRDIIKTYPSLFENPCQIAHNCEKVKSTVSGWFNITSILSLLNTNKILNQENFDAVVNDKYLSTETALNILDKYKLFTQDNFRDVNSHPYPDAFAQALKTLQSNMPLNKLYGSFILENKTASVGVLATALSRLLKENIIQNPDENLYKYMIDQSCIEAIAKKQNANDIDSITNVLVIIYDRHFFDNHNELQSAINFLITAPNIKDIETQIKNGHHLYNSKQNIEEFERFQKLLKDTLLPQIPQGHSSPSLQVTALIQTPQVIQNTKTFSTTGSSTPFWRALHTLTSFMPTTTFSSFRLPSQNKVDNAHPQTERHHSCH